MMKICKLGQLFITLHGHNMMDKEAFSQAVASRVHIKTRRFLMIKWMLQFKYVVKPITILNSKIFKP
jgi:hypothetical protein